MDVESPFAPSNSIELNAPFILNIPKVNEDLEIEEVKSIEHTGLTGSFQLLKLPSNKSKYRYSN